MRRVRWFRVPPIVKTFRQRQDVRRCTANNPFTFEQVRVFDFFGGVCQGPETCRSVWGISHVGPKVSCFSTESHGKQQSFWNLRCTAKLPFRCIFCFMVWNWKLRYFYFETDTSELILSNSWIMIEHICENCVGVFFSHFRMLSMEFLCYPYNPYQE